MNTIRFRLPVCTFLLLLCLSVKLSAATKEDIPVAPIKSSAFQGWSNAYLLANSDITVAIAPAIGRILFLGREKQHNLLTFNKDLVGQYPSAEDDGYWLNYGGDWLFPVAQSRWASFQDSDWPPSRLLDGRPWAGRAWKNADGTQCCLMQQEYGEPLHIKVTRLIKVPPSGSALTIEQRVERIQESSIPVTLWNISQLKAPRSVVFPIEKTSTNTNGYCVMMGKEPGEKYLSLCDGTAVFDTLYDAQVKFGSGSPQRWVAAYSQSDILTEQVTTPMKGLCFPDGGYSIEVYANKGLGYAEIENLSVEKSLNPGETMSNILTFRLSRVEKEQETPCKEAETIRTILFPPQEPTLLEKNGVLSE